MFFKTLLKIKSFTINKNSYFNRAVKGYYNCDYVGYQQKGNPDFINRLKNMPYKGITKDTCEINKSLIFGKDIVLVDDIYTEGVFVAEDCIQTLFDFGVKVLHYM